MPNYSAKSLKELSTCDEQLQLVFNKVIKHFDCSILKGHRKRKEQDEKYRLGLSKVQYPNSKHNSSPSLAVDVAPYPIDWKDRERFHYFAGYVMGTAISLGKRIRWGGDWDKDTQVKDNSFDDLLHFELIL